MKYYGKLQTTVHKGTFKTNTDTFKKMDPYLKLRVGEHEYWTITAANQGLTPVWENVFVIPVQGQEYLEIQAFDEDDYAKDDFLAEGKFPLSSLCAEPIAKAELALLNKSKAEEGKIVMSFKFSVGA